MSLLSAQQFEENEEYEKAFEEYKKIYESNQSNMDVVERLGHLAGILNKTEDAEVYYNKMIELDPHNILAYEQLMDIYISKDKYKYYVCRGNLHVIQNEISHALSDYKKAMNKAKSEKEAMSARFVAATLYEKLDKNNNAIDEYLRVTESDFASEISFLNLANVYLKEDSVSGAIETLERAVEKGFDSEIIKENLASLYLRTNNSEKTRELTGNELVKIKSYLDEGNDEKAYELLNNISDVYKKDSQYFILMAQYYFNKEEWDMSLKYVDEVAKFGQNAALVYQMKALIYEGKHQDYDAHFMWARYNLLRGNRDVALNEYYCAYREKKDDVNLLIEIAELLDETGDKVQAGEFWQSVVKLDETNKKALEKVAEFKESIGDYNEEIKILEKLYNLNKRNYKIALKLARALDKKGKKQSALEYYKKYLDNSPMTDEYEVIQQKVKALENTVAEESQDDEGLIGKIVKLFSKK